MTESMQLQVHPLAKATCNKKNQRIYVRHGREGY